MTDTITKELEKLEGLFKFPDTNPPLTKAKSPAMAHSLDIILKQLQHARNAIETGALSEPTYLEIVKLLEQQKKSLDERQKEIHASLTKLGKSIDKRFVNSLPTLPPLFQSEESAQALERVIGNHFVRSGTFDVADVFYKESSVEPAPDAREIFLNMHMNVTALQQGDVQPTLKWAQDNRQFLKSRGSPLEFYCYRSQFVRMLLSEPPTPPPELLAYIRTFAESLYQDFGSEIRSLMTAMLFTSRERLLRLKYADLASESIHEVLEPMFIKEYCAKFGMSKQLPLKVVGDIGGNGALARIEKGKKVMKDRINDWNQSNELMVSLLHYLSLTY
ncbi:hypothetical protein FRC02_003038 [Tulasnella sp. 418]|nr:hypothetical protein FRC02_003038 [Tulasnella sp. 418]